MKRLLPVLQSLSLGLLIIGCGSSAPLEITKASSLEKIECGSPGFTYTYSAGFVSVSRGQPDCTSSLQTTIAPKTAHRLVAVEIAPKSETETTFKPEDIALTDSAGKRYLPIGVAHPANLGSFKNFEVITGGTLKMQSPDGTAVTVGKEQKDAPTTFAMSGKGARAALIYEVLAEGGSFQLKVSDFSPMTVTVQSAR